MTRILDQSVESTVAEAVVGALKEEGFEAEVAIPGLIKAIVCLAEETWDPVQALDEAADILTDQTIDVEADIDG